MAVRRIYVCILVLGIAGIFGFGVMRSIAQTDAPALNPEQLKPSDFSYPKVSAPAADRDNDHYPPAKAPALIADAAEPNVRPVLEPMKSPEPAAIVPPPFVEPAIEPKVTPQPEKPVPTTSAAPEIPLLPPVIEPEPLVRQKDAAPAVTPKVESVAPPVVAPKIEPVAPAVEAVKPAPSKPETPMMLPPIETAPTSSPAKSSAANRVMPAVSIETIAPESVPYGQPVTYEIVVKNQGPLAVSHVRVDEEMGPGTKFISAEPVGELNGDKVLWMLGTLNAGEEKHIKVGVKPGNEGDLTTNPRVTYSAATSMNVRVTRPSLVINVSASETVQVGDEVPVKIQVSNNGTGDASKITLKAILSDGLKHPEGNDIQAALNKLAPGESQTVTLHLQAGVPGAQSCTLSALADGASKTTAQAKFDIRQPKLNLAVTGPTKCIVRAEPVFTVEITNPGTSATDQVQVAAAFPEGLDYVSSSDSGTFDPATRTVSWNLPAAAPNSKRQLTVKTKSSIAGTLAVRVVAQGGPKLNARGEAIIQAEGVPALMFEVVDLEDPIEVGKETTYEIRVANTGSMHCTNVKLTAALSDGLIPGTVTSNVPHKIVGQTMVFDPIAKLAVKSDLIIRVRAKGTTAGDHRFKVQLSCDQMKLPVVKEESTSFFQQ